jgi:putative glutamine amidotransferase
VPRAPLIAVTTSIVNVGKDTERAALNSAYLAAIQRAGGVPLVLPPQLGDDARRDLFERSAGVLLTGGGDVDPARFTRVPRHPAVDGVSLARDQLEIELVSHALEQGKPLLAICRGVQVLNVALGGTLYQDVPSELGSATAHDQDAPRHAPTHRVRVVPDSRLARLLGVAELEVNSFHHQAIRDLGPGFRAVAFADDGVIEGAELDDPTRFAVGVQWHPEELEPHDETARRLFRALVDGCR